MCVYYFWYWKFRVLINHFWWPVPNNYAIRVYAAHRSKLYWNDKPSRIHNIMIHNNTRFCLNKICVIRSSRICHNYKHIVTLYIPYTQTYTWMSPILFLLYLNVSPFFLVSSLWIGHTVYIRYTILDLHFTRSLVYSTFTHYARTPKNFLRYKIIYIVWNEKINASIKNFILNDS